MGVQKVWVSLCRSVGFWSHPPPRQPSNTVAPEHRLHCVFFLGWGEAWNWPWKTYAIPMPFHLELYLLILSVCPQVVSDDVCVLYPRWLESRVGAKRSHRQRRAILASHTLQAINMEPDVRAVWFGPFSFQRVRVPVRFHVKIGRRPGP